MDLILGHKKKFNKFKRIKKQSKFFDHNGIKVEINKSRKFKNFINVELEHHFTK